MSGSKQDPRTGKENVEDLCERDGDGDVHEKFFREWVSDAFAFPYDGCERAVTVRLSPVLISTQSIPMTGMNDAGSCSEGSRKARFTAPSWGVFPHSEALARDSDER